MEVKDKLLDFWFWLRGEIPRQDRCEYCGMSPPYYYKECTNPLHTEEFEREIDRQEGNLDEDEEEDE